jgi:hypothetical protein
VTHLPRTLDTSVICRVRRAHTHTQILAHTVICHWEALARSSSFFSLSLSPSLSLLINTMHARSQFCIHSKRLEQTRPQEYFVIYSPFLDVCMRRACFLKMTT